MFKKISSLFSKNTDHQDKGSKSAYPEYDQILTDLLTEINNRETTRNYFTLYDVKFGELNAYNALKKKEISFKQAFTKWLVSDVVKRYRKKKMRPSFGNDNVDQKLRLEEELLPLLFRSNLQLSDEDYIYYFKHFRNNKYSHYGRLNYWPVGFLTQQLERKNKKGGIGKELKNFLKTVLSWKELNSKNNYYGSDLSKVKNKIEAIVFENSHPENTIKTFAFNAGPFGDFANAKTKNLSSDFLETIFPILHLCFKVTGAKPTKKFIAETSGLIDQIDFKKYKAFIYTLLEKVIEIQPIETVHQNRHNGETYTYSSYVFIDKEDLNTLKGLVWTLAKFHDTTTLTLLAKLGERCFKKIPGTGPTAAALGNACIYVLANTKGMEGIAQLNVLKQRIKQTSTKKLIDKYIDELSSKLGISQSDIEESVVPDFGLEFGKKSFPFDKYQLHIQIERIGKVTTSWIKPDGNTQKTNPSFIKESKTLTDKLKKVRAEIKEIQKFLTSQRDRLDNLFLEEKVISHENFHNYYFNHGLVSYVAQKLIWIIANNHQKTVAYYYKNHWIDSTQNKIDWVDTNCSFQLWHPIYAKTEEILSWREFLRQELITQPLKQAFREIYLLTPAEINTKSYSNRMASHILKQHQFNTLAKLRNWTYQLIGAWDHGSDCIARKQIGKTGITAQYWLNEVFDNDLYNEAGILLYMSTDQVRFIKENDEEPLDLIDVPAIMFSEIMRDVDLFVGVCSVGNDPEWQDNGGLPQYRDYWQAYSFGNLTEVAKTRKTILEGLVPRLKIKDIAHIDGKFLVVKGKLRTYKIHIGSTNILMEPNDQYLCIVPSGKKQETGKVYLPFDGDRGLSVVLSKAFLLAEDDKITDTTITRQLKL